VGIFSFSFVFSSELCINSFFFGWGLRLHPLRTEDE